MTYENQRVISWTYKVQDVLDRGEFDCILSTGCNYYNHKDKDNPKLEFTSDGEDIFGTADSISWLHEQAYPKTGG